MTYARLSDARLEEIEMEVRAGMKRDEIAAAGRRWRGEVCECCNCLINPPAGKVTLCLRCEQY
jgi:hypothetical protein